MPPEGPTALSQNEILIATGDVLPGVGTVAGVAEVVVADGGRWAAAVFIEGTAPFAQALVLDDQVLLGPGDPLPGFPGETFRYAGGLDLAPDGTLTWVENKLGGTTSFGRAVFSGLTPLLKAGEVPVGPGLAGAGPWTGFVEARQDGAGGLVVRGNFDRPGFPSFFDDVIARLPSAVSGGPVTVLIGEGDPFPESSGTVSFLSDRDHSLAANATSTLFQAGGETEAVVLDAAVVAQTGETTPLFGDLWQGFTRHALDLNAAGDVAHAGRVATGSGSATYLISNGALVARTGTPVAAVEPYALESLAQGSTALAPIRLDAAGRLFWYADWADPDTSRDEGLFRDLELVVLEGATRAGGLTITSLKPPGALFDLRPLFDVTEDGAFVAARVGLADGRVAAVRIALEPATEVLPGCAGNAATLSAPTEFGLGQQVTLLLGDGQATNALGFVALSVASPSTSGPCGVDVPGFGELLVDLGPGALLTLTPTLLPAIPGIASPAILGIVPDDLSLLGLELYAQGVWFDQAGRSSPFEPVRPSNALRLRVGL